MMPELAESRTLGQPVPQGGPGPRRDQAVAQTDRWAVVLAGGEGKRLQWFVRQALGIERPKQFCQIIGTRSMLRHTWDRAARLVAPERIVTVITAGQERYLEEEARRGVPGPVLVQPANKDTAPGLLLPLLWIGRRDPAATVVVYPADHFVWEEERFAACLRSGVLAAAELPDRLALLGVEADAADVSYGWIAPGAPLGGGCGAEVYAVRRFWEKPDRATAARLLAAGHLWNTLVLAGRLPTYLALAEACLPDVLEPLRAVADCLGTPAQAWALREAYRCLAATNLSQAVLARRPDRLMVLAARGICWSDWGDPDRILRTLRRIDRRPHWLPAYVRTQVQAAAGL